MNPLIFGVLLTTLSVHAKATPSNAVVDTCLRTVSVSPKVRYVSIDVGAFEVIEDVEARETMTILRDEMDTVGTWQGKGPPTFGLVMNGRETPLSRVIRLDKKMVPTAFNPYEAIWGVAKEGQKSYICATFNFEGVGKSGSFQKVRGLYLIERSKRTSVPFYKVRRISETAN